MTKDGEAAMDLNLLGVPEILPRVGRGELRRAKELCLLAVLALTPGQVVTAESLVSKVWDDDSPPETVRATLRSYMSRVKVAVTDVGGASVESARGGYLLRIDRENVDVHRFGRLVAQADSIAKSGDAEHAVSLLREAEGLWRGDALAGLPGRWIESYRQGLAEERMLATKKRVQLELGLGRHEELVGELRTLTHRFPLDEAWTAYQMMALYRSGRQADALSLYREDYERRVEVGLDRVPGLAALQQRIIRQDPTLEATPARRLQQRRPWNDGLPLRPATLVGRDKELATLCGAADTGQVRIIDGMGGSGKTALAIEAAFRLREVCPDPPVFVSFHAHEAGQAPLGAREALCQLCELAGIAPEPAPQSTAALTAIWQREVSRRRSVIVLDDVPDSAAIVPVLPVSGSCVVLVTSRPRLAALPADVVLTLDELPVDDAITLFARTAGLPKMDDPAVLSRAVRLCGCLPLALTLSASRLRDEGLTVSGFVEEIIERRAFPERAGVTDPRLMQTFELSYAGLDAEHREFFRRLGLSPCLNVSPRTAAVLVGTSVAAAEAALDVLHGRHLVERSIADRFRLHDLIREYAEFAAERDDPGWERRRAMRRLLDYYLGTASQADTLLYPHRRRAHRVEDFPGEGIEVASPDAAGKWFELEWRNIMKLADYAARHEWKQHCADLVAAASGFLDARGHWSDGIDINRMVLRVCRDLGDSPRLARAASDLSLLELRRGNHADALRHADEAIDIYRAIGDGHSTAEILDRLGTIQRRMGQARAALAYHQEALEIYRKLPDQHGIAEALCHAGAAYHGLGRYGEAVAHHESALLLYRETGDRKGEAKTFNNIGDALCEQGFYPDAMSYFEKALDLFQQVNALHYLAPLRLNMGHIAKSKGRYQDAIAAYRAALTTCRETGDLLHQASAYYEIGVVYQFQELYDQALIHQQRAETIAVEIGDLSTQASVNLGIADALRGSGNYDRALERYRHALELALQTEDLLRKGRALEGLAETRLRMRDLTAARVLLREALDAFRLLGVPDAGKVALRLAAFDILNHDLAGKSRQAE
ncbi:MAG: tetratricopeptide repeat protein [Trebonia sp.]